MAIKKFILLGDTHGANVKPARQARRMYPDLQPNEIGLIILGDAGFNCGRPEEDSKWKKIVNKIGIQIFCVRGNHDVRPEKIERMVSLYNKDIQGWVYNEPDAYPNIFYLIDNEIYIINGLRTLVVGGAYSVDKEYRLKNNMFWEPEEQLNENQRRAILKDNENKHFNLILSHTCPISWQPTDLFLSFVDQSTVDNTMEVFLEELKDTISFDCWLFGHYHKDRLMRPNVMMLYQSIISLEDIVEICINKNLEYTMGWEKDPKYYI